MNTTTPSVIATPVRGVSPGLAPVAIAFGLLLTPGVFAGLLGVAWPSICGTFGVGLAALGVFIMFQMGGFIISGTLAGRLIERFGIAPLLTAGLVLRAAGLAVGIVAPSWGLFLAIGVAYGVGSGIIDAGINTFATGHFRPRVLSWMHASYGIGTTVGALMMTALLADGTPWQMGVGVVLALHVVVGMALALTRSHWHLPIEDEPAAPTDAARVVSIRATLGLPVVAASICAFFLYTGVEFTFGNWGFTLLSEGRGITPEAAGLAATLFWASLTAGRLLFAFIELRLVQMVRVATAGVLAGALLLALPFHPLLAWAGLLMAGLALAPIFPTLITLTPRRTGKRHSPNAIGFQIAAAGLGGGVMSVAAGRLVVQFGLESIPLFTVAGALALFLLHELVIRLSPTRNL